MSDTRSLKITVRAAVRVYMPRDRVAERATPVGSLRARLESGADWWSDGRRHYLVEQLHKAVEGLVRTAIERGVEDHLRTGDFAPALASLEANAAWDKLTDHVGLAMARVSVGEIDITDDHTLTFEIEEGP